MIEQTIGLILYCHLEYNCDELFLSKLPSHECRLNTFEFWAICNQPNTKFRIRAWNRFKRKLPLDGNSDKLIKQIEKAADESGYRIK